MNKEKYIGEAALKDKLSKKLTLVIKDGSVTTNKVTDAAITTPKIAEQAITDGKLGDGAVVERTINEGAVTTSKIASEAVETDKIKNGAITNDKIAQDTLTKDKLNPNLRKALDAAVGLPDDLTTTIQNIDKNLDKLNSTVYPIVPELNISPNVLTMKTAISYSVRSDNKYLVPDTLSITKRVNDLPETILTNYPTSNSNLTTPIQGVREIFKFTVTKENKTEKNISQTKYLCYYGVHSVTTITAEILNTFTRISTTGVSFNPKVTTKDNDYIWLVVPSYLSIKVVTSAGFGVTLSAPQTITNDLGSFKAYRTINSLTEATWDLVIL